MKERKNNRIKNYDYSQNGYYFVTICIKNKYNFFGKIKNNKMFLNKYGKIIEKQWLWLEQHYKYVKLDEYIIMPDHFHGILIIDKTRVFCRDRSRVFCRDRSRVFCRDRSRVFCRDRSRPVSTKSQQKIKPLSELIGAFKMTSSKIIHQNGLKQFFWQRSFYDHIIYDENSLTNIRKYIKNNPIKHML